MSDNPFIWNTEDGSYTLDFSKLPADIYRKWEQQGASESRGYASGDAAVNMYLTSMKAFNGQKAVDALIKQYGTPSTPASAAPTWEPSASNKNTPATATISRPPTMEDYTKIGTDGAPVFDSDGYYQRKYDWDRTLEQLNLDPATYDPRTNTVKDKSGQQFGMFQQGDTMQVMDYKRSADYMKQQGKQRLHPMTPQDIARQRTIANTGIDPTKIGVPKVSTDNMGNQVITFENAQQLAYYTGVVTEQAKMEFENADFKPKSTYGPDVVAQHQAQQVVDQQKTQLQDLIKSKPADKVIYSLGDMKFVDTDRNLRGW